MIIYRDGNVLAFDELYSRYEKRLFSFLCRRLPGNESLALDVFQLTWLKLHSARANFDKAQKVSGWLFTIAINTLRDEIGEAWNRYSREFDENETHQGTANDTPLVNLEREELREMVDGVLARLPGHQREAIVLSDIEGFSSKEIAEMMGISDGAVRQLIFRGRKEFAELFRALGARSA